jgi:MoaA/NifB/PqqE/SkfB family radical SAM enzyme
MTIFAEQVDSVAAQVPPEFGIMAPGLGFSMAGWNFGPAEIANAIHNHIMLNPAMELARNVCPWNCSFCFTEDPSNLTSRKHRFRNELTLAERLSLVDQAKALGARSINIVGAGEPTIDPDFWAIVNYIADLGICPIVYTEASLRLTDKKFVRRLFRSGATAVIKVNSLWNSDYQNSVVRGNGKAIPGADSYTTKRNRAIELLIEEGFASSEPTRLAFDTIICRQNRTEVVELHRYARRNNIFILLVNYLPSGRSSSGPSDAISLKEQAEVFDTLACIDRTEFGIDHASRFPYGGGVPCSIRGLGLFIKINGNVFDCPGESISLGNTRTNSLDSIWRRAREVTLSFDGGCAPRDQFWQSRVNNLAYPSTLVQIGPFGR